MEVDDENVFVVLQRQGGCVISGLFLQCFFVFFVFCYVSGEAHGQNLIVCVLMMDCQLSGEEGWEGGTSYLLHESPNP